MSSNRDKDGEKHTDRELKQGQLLDDNLGDEDDLNDNDDEDDEDIISDGLLTSLTDAAINNLSQLAALQERCESQQYSQEQQAHQHQHQFPPQSQSALDQSGPLPVQTQVHNSSLFTEDPQSQEKPCETTDTSFNLQDPFSASNIANQAALAISATAAALKGGPSSLMLTHSSPNPISQNSTIQADLSSRQSLTSVVAAAAAAVANKQHQQQQQQHQYQHEVHGQGQNQISLAQQTRLISSALSSPEFYQNLQQYHQQQQQDQQQLSNVHQQTSPISSLHFSPSTSIAPSPSSSSGQIRRSGSITSSGFLSPTTSPNYLRKQFMSDKLPLLSPSPTMMAGGSSVAQTSLSHILQQHHHNQQQRQEQQHQRSYVQQTGLPHHLSSISSLQFSPSTSITPSPSSLIGQSRRSGSSAGSSFMSPTASPNYLQRQFMPDRLPLLSPSPSMTTGSSSAASTSLSHILQQQQHHRHHHQQRSASALAGSIISPSSNTVSSSGSTALSPLISGKNASQARLNNMQIRHKFGYLGSGRGQFNSPHGFCLGVNQEIVVADTNNHRICIFDKSGTYITQFGSPGKEEGQLWNPRKVAILHRPVAGGSSGNDLHQRHNPGQIASTYSSHFTSGGGIQNTGSGLSNFASEPLYVVCDRGAERSRMQLFTKDGVFIKKIGIHYIDIVAGLAITQTGLIIVVDSVSPTVYIINAETGTLNGWFDCSGHMKEPSDIAVKSDIPGNEYFICDFKGHCVVVFSEQGEYLRKIGHDGLTSYPNGIDISDDGDILVGDSHGNRFHVVVFDRNGNFVSQFECPHVKVSRCCGLKITREGYIVTLAKNNHHVLVLDTIHI